MWMFVPGGNTFLCFSVKSQAFNNIYFLKTNELLFGGGVSHKPVNSTKSKVNGNPSPLRESPEIM